MTAVVTGIHSRFACQDGALADGNGTTFDVSHYTYLLAQVTVAGTATVNFEMSADNSTWVACLAQNVETGVVATTATATGHYYVCVAGAQTFRARISGWSSGAVDVDITAFYGTPLLPSAVSTSGSSTVDTELPAASVLADNTANPTVPGVASFNMLWDGTTWDRAPLGPTNGDGNVLSQGNVHTAGMTFNGSNHDRLRSVTTGTNSTGTGIAAAGLVAQFDDTSPTAITENQFGNVRMSVTHDLRTSYPVPEASAVIAPSTYKSTGSVTKGTVKASAGNVFSFYITNENAALRYFQLHNKATDPAGADTAQLYFPVPAGTAAAPTVLIIGVDFLGPSERFATGIGWAISTTAATFTDSATASEHDVTVRYV